MAETPGMSAVAIDATLRDLHAVLDDLPRIADGWDRRDEDSQVTFYLEWDELMRRLASVTRAYRQGLLPAEQAQSYQAIAAKLHRVREQIEQLDLTTAEGISPPATPD